MDYRIGFHVKSMRDLRRVRGLSGINLVELKPEKFRENGEELYTFDGSNFRVVDARVSEIADLCGDVQVNVHLPFEEKVDPSDESGLCYAERSHHDLLLARFDMFGVLHRTHRIGEVITVHPPAFRFGGRDTYRVAAALETGVEFFSRLDALIRDKGYAYKIGLENMSRPKTGGSSCIGYSHKHIDRLIGDTSQIGITIDSGHRKLNDETSIARLVSYGKIVNVHLHSNSGDVSFEHHHDDAHLLAVPEEMPGDNRYTVLPHFQRYVKTIRRLNLPVVLEVKLSKYSDGELEDYVADLRRRLGPR